MDYVRFIFSTLCILYKYLQNVNTFLKISEKTLKIIKLLLNNF